MFLFKRKGIYYLEYFNEVENRKKRISTKKKKKPGSPLNEWARPDSLISN